MDTRFFSDEEIHRVPGLAEAPHWKDPQPPPQAVLTDTSRPSSVARKAASNQCTPLERVASLPCFGWWLLLHGAPDVADVRAQLVGRAHFPTAARSSRSSSRRYRRRLRLLLRRRVDDAVDADDDVDDADESDATDAPSSSAASSAWSSARFRARWTTTRTPT